MVFWGFTGATGVRTNEQRVCLNYISFTESLNDTAICVGDTVPLDVGTGASFSWTPATGLSATNIANPLAFPTTTTQYFVTVTDACGGTRMDSVIITVDDSANLNFSLPNDTIVCQGSQITLLPSLNQPYLWQDSSIQNSFITDSASTYWAEYSNACGTRRDSQVVEVELLPTVDLGPDTLLCGPNSYTLSAAFASATAFGTQYLWQDNSNLDSLVAMGSGLYWAEVSNFCGTVRDSVQLSFAPPVLPVDLGPDTLLCTGDTLLLSTNQAAGVTFQWQDGSILDSFVVRTSGQYYVTASSPCGTETDTINVTFQALPTANLGPDTTLCYPDTLVLDPGPNPAGLYIWNTGDLSQTIVVRDTGQFIVAVLNTCGDVATDTIDVNYFNPPVADLGADTLLCPGDTLLLAVPNEAGSSYLWQNGSLDTAFVVRTSGQYHIAVTNFCGRARDTINVTYQALPSVSLGADTTICRPDTLILDAGPNPAGLFVWNTGDLTQTLVVRDTGTYIVGVANTCGDVASDTIFVDFRDQPVADLGPDSTLCPGDSLLLTAPNLAGTTYLWQNGSPDTFFMVRNPGLYHVAVSNFCGTARDSMTASFQPTPTVNLGADTLLCRPDTLVLGGPVVPGIGYLWSDGSLNSTLVVRDTGTYWLLAANQCGDFANDSIRIDYTQTPSVDLGNDSTLCSGQTWQLDISHPDATSYQWIGGPASPTFNVTMAGTYIGQASNGCGTASDTLNVSYDAPPTVDLGPDTLFCATDSLVLDASFPGASYLWQDGLTDSARVIRTDGLYWVEVTTVVAWLGILSM